MCDECRADTYLSDKLTTRTNMLICLCCNRLIISHLMPLAVQALLFQRQNVVNHRTHHGSAYIKRNYSGMALETQNPGKTALVVACYRILKSLAKFSIRIGLSSGTVCELVRRAFVDAAEELLIEDGEKVQSTSISAMTGLYRKEIVRLREMPVPGAAAQEDKYNRSARIVTGWMRDPDFQDDSGKPAPLNIKGEVSFAELVKRYSGDMAATAMRDELERLGVVEVTDDGQLTLVSSGYVSSNTVEGIHILGTDTADLIDTINNNLLTDNPSRFQRKVSYDGIPPQHAESFRLYAADASQKLLEELDRWLDDHDVDPTGQYTQGLRLGVGIYHFEKSSADEDYLDEPDQ